jgi:nitrogenase molybdenum-iron protein alpha/beta subunit
MNDVAVVLHGPLSCAYLMDTARAKAVLELYAGGIYSTVPNHNLRCTMMDDGSSIFGGVGNLHSTLMETMDEGYRKIAVVTTCMPGIIGDDSRTVIDKVIEENPGVRIDYIPADGDINGEFTDGFIMAVEKIADLIDTSLEKERGTVNIIGSSFFDLHSTRHLKEMRKLFSAFGLRENSRFLDETTSKTVEGFCRGQIDIMVNDSAATREMASVIESKTGRKVLSVPLPVGLHDYVEWVREIGKIMGMDEEAAAEVERAESDHRKFIEVHSDSFRGRKVIIMNRASQNIDWLIDMLIWLGADVCRVGRFPSTRKSGSKFPSRYSEITTHDYDIDCLRRDLAEMDPDLLIGEFAGRVGDRCRIARVGKVGIGVLPTKEYVEYLENIMGLPQEEGWKKGCKK